MRLDKHVGGRDAGHIDVTHVARVQVDCVEAGIGAVEDFHASFFFDRHVNQERLVLQIREGLECHEFTVGLLRPGIHFDAILKANYEKFDFVELNDFKVNTALELANINKARLFLVLK